MASNLTQSQQLSQIPGSAGQVSVIQDRTPTVGQGLQSLVSAGAKMYDVAGDIYSKNQAQSMVTEEINNIEHAQAIAERKVKDENFVEPDLMPVDAAEFTIIENAVRSGAMSREKARLMASSRLRTRISEEPFFADKLRQAASQVVGFNIMSEPAQQYFASFKTEAQLAANSANSQQQKWWDQAMAEHAGMPDVPVEEIYRQIAQESYAARQKELAASKKAMGLHDDMQEFNEVDTANSAVDFGAVLGNFKRIYEQNGSVDEQAAAQIISQAKAARFAELDQIFQDKTSTEYQRAQQVIEARFNGYAEFVESVGFDNLNQLRIDRVKAANEILGNKMFQMEKFIIQNLGADTFNQTLDMISTINDPSRLEAMFRSSPISGQVAGLMGNQTAVKAFGDQLATVWEKIAAKQPPATTGPNEQTGMTEEDVTNAILQKMFERGGESEVGALEYMEENGLESKPVSMIVQKTPSRATEGSKRYFKTMYTNTLPAYTEQLAGVLANNPDLEWAINDKGQFEIVKPQPSADAIGGRAMREDMRRVQRQMQTYNEAQRFAEHINLYGQGISTGWGSEVDITPPEYRRKIAQIVDKGYSTAATGMINEAFNLMLENNDELGRETWSKLQRIAPQYREFTYEQQKEAVRRANEQGGWRGD